MIAFIDKFRHSKYYEEKRRFLLFVFLLFLILFLAGYLFQVAYARYEVNTKLNSNIKKALYILGTDNLSFNLEPDGIVPSDNPYVYKFSVSNFNEKNDTDVDIYYNVSVKTTTNLPINIKLYRNENYDDNNSTNIFGGSRLVQDVDGAWYNLYKNNEKYEMYYKDKTTDVYTIVINFPKEYAKDTTYENYIESIEVDINSKQM